MKTPFVCALLTSAVIVSTNSNASLVTTLWAGYIYNGEVRTPSSVIDYFIDDNAYYGEPISWSVSDNASGSTSDAALSTSISSSASIGADLFSYNASSSSAVNLTTSLAGSQQQAGSGSAFSWAFNVTELTKINISRSGFIPDDTPISNVDVEFYFDVCNSYGNCSNIHTSTSASEYTSFTLNPILDGGWYEMSGGGGTGIGTFTTSYSVDANWSVNVTAVSAVPVPAAAWLFGSGLLGLVGVARRKKVNKRGQIYLQSTVDELK